MAALSRLQTAISEGLALPSGKIAVVRPDTSFDLSPLAGRQVVVVTTFAPEAAHWAGQGFYVTDDLSDAETILICVPRSKAFARTLIAEAAETGALVVVDGDKTDGVDSLFRDCRKRLGQLPSLTKAHGRIFWLRSDAFADWIKPGPLRGDHGFVTQAGIYSEGGVDKGSALLAEALPDDLKGRVADFGAGWGYLTCAILDRKQVSSVDLIEAENRALDCARANVVDPRASFHWADATVFKAEASYDMIVMNPPFHHGGDGDPSLGQAFIASAAGNLKPSGQLWMVANRHLPYEMSLQKYFLRWEEVGGNGAFKVFHASRPKR